MAPRKRHISGSRRTSKAGKHYLKTAAAIMHLNRCSGDIKKRAPPHTSDAKRRSSSSSCLEEKHPSDAPALTPTATQRFSFLLTLIWQLADIRGHRHVQHVVDSRVYVVSSLDVVLTVRLVALFMATVLQTVALQVLEGGSAAGDGEMLINCHISFSSHSLLSHSAPCLRHF